MEHSNNEQENRSTEKSDRIFPSIGIIRDYIGNKLRMLTNSKVQESTYPTKEALGYESKMGIYGAKLIEEDGKMILNTRGLWSKIDRHGDRLLRLVDEHHVKKLAKTIMRKPRAFIGTLPLIADAKRYRGTPEQIMQNVERLGLGEYYERHPHGIAIKQPDLYKKSVALLDIYNQDELKADILNNIDRFDALAQGSSYLRRVHDTHGGIGEFNIYHVLFQKIENGKVSDPIMTLPDIIYNPEKNIPDGEQKATDLLDYLASAAAEEWRRTQNKKEITHAIDTILEGYGDIETIKITLSFAKRGRLTLPNDSEEILTTLSPVMRFSRNLLALHNTQRLAAKKETSALFRQTIIDECTKFIAENSDKTE